MGSRAEPRGVTPLSERICDAACIASASWTLLCHAFVAAGGGLRPLLATWLALATAGAVAWSWTSRRRGSGIQLGRAGPSPRTPAPISDAPAPRALALRFAQPLGLVVGLLAMALFARGGQPVELWWSLLVLMAAAGLVFLVLEEPLFEAPARDPRLEAGVWALAAACLLFTLVVHRPDIDDSFYVNLAVAALDRPELPLLAVDTLHGIDALPIHYPAYRLHSFELANAALVLLSGIPPIYAFHWVSAGIAAVFVPLAHARLTRLLVPRIWLWTTGAVLLVLIFAGETHRWYGNFAFVRLWQGKGVFLFVFLPLVYAYAIRFALRPGVRAWLLLAAAQIGAVGCSSSALWAAPVASFTAMCSVLRPDLSGLRRFGAGAAASLYVLVAGASIKGPMVAQAPTLKRVFAPGHQLTQALRRTLGEGDLYLVGLAAIFAAWACCRRGLAQRFAIALPLAVSAVLLNPYLDGFVRSHVTGPSYWRCMWALPVPLLMALVLTAPLQWKERLRGASYLAAAALCVAFVVWVPRYTSFSPRNDAFVSWPRAKVVENPWRWAAALSRIAPREAVVAPAGVSAWVPTFRDHAYPLQVRVYLTPHRERIGREDYQRRKVMTALVGGRRASPGDLGQFRAGLERYAVRAACVRNSATAPALRKILRDAGFRRRLQGIDMEIWLRDGRGELRPGAGGERVGRAPTPAPR